MSRVLLATLGSLGDLNPALAMAKALEAAGHRVRIAANPMLAHATRAQGLPFVPLGRLDDPTDLSDYVRGALISNPGVPTGWPMFCGAFDVAAAAYLAWRLATQRRHQG